MEKKCPLCGNYVDGVHSCSVTPLGEFVPNLPLYGPAPEPEPTIVDINTISIPIDINKELQGKLNITNSKLIDFDGYFEKLCSAFGFDENLSAGKIVEAIIDDINDRGFEFERVCEQRNLEEEKNGDLIEEIKTLKDENKLLNEKSSKSIEIINKLIEMVRDSYNDGQRNAPSYLSKDQDFEKSDTAYDLQEVIKTIDEIK